MAVTTPTADPTTRKTATCTTCRLMIFWEPKHGSWLTFSGGWACEARPDFGQHSPAEGSMKVEEVFS